MREHPGFSPPTEFNPTLWRYLKPGRLISLLETSKIFFARADTLGDPFEGSYPRRQAELRKVLYAGATDQYLDEGLPAQAQTLRKLFFASCWHMAEHESELMWRRYGNDGFAIKSSVTALRSSMLDESHCFLMGPVQYLDYSTDLLWEGNAFNALFAKKREYEADREFRIACELLSRIGDVDLGRFEPPPGLPIDVDLPKLIQAIVYRRGVDPPQLDMAQTISKQSGLQACFELSALDEEPSY